MLEEIVQKGKEDCCTKSKGRNVGGDLQKVQKDCTKSKGRNLQQIRKSTKIV